MIRPHNSGARTMHRVLAIGLMLLAGTGFLAGQGSDEPDANTLFGAGDSERRASFDRLVTTHSPLISLRRLRP